MSEADATIHQVNEINDIVRMAKIIDNTFLQFEVKRKWIYVFLRLKKNIFYCIFF